MTKLVPISRAQLLKRLRRFGFDWPFSGGKHQFMCRGELDLTIPNPHKRDIGVDLLVRLLQQAGISREEWGV